MDPASYGWLMRQGAEPRYEPQHLSENRAQFDTQAAQREKDAEESRRKPSNRICIMESKRREEEEKQAAEEDAAIRKTEAKRIARERRRAAKLQAEARADTYGGGAVPDDAGAYSPDQHGHGTHRLAADFGDGYSAGTNGASGSSPMPAHGAAPGAYQQHDNMWQQEQQQRMPAWQRTRTAQPTGWTPLGKLLRAACFRRRNTRRRKPSVRRLQMLALMVRDALVADSMASEQARLAWLRGELEHGQKDTVMHLQNMIKAGSMTQDEARSKLTEVQQLADLALSLAPQHPSMDLSQLVQLAQHLSKQQELQHEQQAQQAQQRKHDHMLQQQLMSRLPPDKMDQLRSMSRADQQRVLHALMQQHVMAQQRPHALAGAQHGHPMHMGGVLDDPLMMANLPPIAREAH